MVSQTFPFSAVLPCADKHTKFSQHKDLLLLSGIVTFKRERAAVFSEGKIPPLMDVHSSVELKTDDLLGCETTRPSP